MFLEDINNILNLGEVPNIFTPEEKAEVVEAMRTLETQLDKSLHTEGGSQELFDLFIRMVIAPNILYLLHDCPPGAGEAASSPGHVHFLSQLPLKSEKLPVHPQLLHC